MHYSTKYHMKKPELNEQYRLEPWNDNTDILDTIIDNIANCIISSNTNVNGNDLNVHNIIRIMFDSNINGSDTSTGLTITYNENTYPVKVNKNGSLVNFVAKEITNGNYRYLQAYTVIEMIYDGTQFIIRGNPIVLSADDYTIFANGKLAIDDTYPINSVYVQYPQQKSPNDLYKFTSWTEIDYAGKFFRASGGNASSFVEEGGTLTVQSNQNKSHSHTTNSQSETTTGDPSRTHTHNVSYRSGGVTAGTAKNALLAQYSGGTEFVGGTTSTSNEHTHDFSHTHGTTSEGGNEARPDNYTIKIWKRIA